MSQNQDPHGAVAAVRQVVDSSFWKLLAPVIGAVILFGIQQISAKMDRIEANQVLMGTTVAISASELAELKGANQKREMDVAELRKAIGDTNTRISVLEARTK